MPSHQSAQVNTLPHPDGSATVSSNGYTVLCTVNGPLEAQRRDEQPLEAFIEVHIRPANGVGGPPERSLESTLLSFLHPIILTPALPRSLIQITLQILSVPPTAQTLRTGSAASVARIALLPSLAHAAQLALLAARIPMRTVACVASLAVVEGTGEVGVVGVGETGGGKVEAVHAVGYSRQGKCLLWEMSGRGDGRGMKAVEGEARRRCLVEGGKGEDVVMGGVEGRREDLMGWLEGTIGGWLKGQQRWKGES
ncbi:hypothetical protein P152DRAFT_430077 [Eremomyces bilateralis CBS 781.70]|uniref:Exoribonuclease phosphorolytic domain-containing protein n=1 Tax=Eremomyces bilateralis CBS 781.70 TaxID=1392243 RepID=A0A6G1GCH5_9PEZI|nr:uncharacterized protein P152DRAFT_430077 [Eremomyces bilateralis CBS 781.70]KAF1815787.1 hypothetical protein P152DRAFT_430077 [Eremomyces bilateralis CBS 781.70]